MKLRTLSLAAAALAALALPRPVPAQQAAEEPVPAVRVARATGPITLDGRLDDAAWAAAEVVSAFTQVDPTEGEAATERTEARILHDGEALYVAIRGHDRGRVSTRLGRRDMDLGDSDWFGVVIDSYHDHRTAFSFDVNPSGVRRDATKTDDGDDLSWDAVWDAAAARDSGGWSAEYRIPFSQLRFNPAETTWGLQLERIIGRRNEYAVWSFTPRARRGGIARFGHLSGVEGVAAGKRLEVLPYTVTRAERVERGSNPFRRDAEYGASFGVDVKYRVTTDLTLDATLNPDFGQVEVDPATVNLTAFETVFDEKRPFFVEGSEIFAFGGGNLPTGGGLFYSRRVGGRSSRLAPSPLAPQDVPTETAILGAAKLTGKTAGGWSVGVLDALTGREEARWRDAEGRDQAMAVEPLTNFFVGRVRKDLRAGQTFVGGMVTAVDRRLDEDALSATLLSGAYTAGVDFRHEFADRAWALTGYASGSHVRGSREALLLAQERPWRTFGRPDAAHMEVDSQATAMTGASAALRLAREAGEHWRGSVGVSTITPGYEVADLGSQRRGDRIDTDAGVRYLQFTPGKLLRRWDAYASVRREWNYGGDHIFSQLLFAVSGQTLGYWNADVDLIHMPRALDDRLTRGGPLALRPARSTVVAQLSSDGRKAVVGNGGVFFERGEHGHQFVELFGGAEVKAAPRWSLSVGPSFSRTASPAQYLGSRADATDAALFGRRYFFSALDQRTLSLDTRVNYTFSPALTLEVFLQPFISAVDFRGETKYLAAPRSFSFTEDPSAEVRGSDFNVRSLRGNAVLRWEWRRGSTLYLAWQQQRENVEGVGDFDLTRDRRALFGADPDNVFVVKMNYWLNP